MPKRRRPLLLVAALLTIATFTVPETALAGATSDITFHIRKGRHGDSSRGSGLRCLQLKRRVDRTVRYQIRFRRNCAYTLPGADQFDWNKAPGWTTARIHHNSIRLGWRWLPADQKIELGFYGYVRGQRISRALVKVPLETWVDVEVRLHNGGLRVTVAGRSYEERRSLGFSRWLPTPTWFLKTAYFGGNRTAPHAMDIDVRRISIR